MAKPFKKMNDIKAAALLKIGRPFFVPGVREQKLVLTTARPLGIRISTSKIDRGGFIVRFMKD